jgi:threonine synthase
MRLYNIKVKSEVVSFIEAAHQSIGSAGGLYFPERLPYFANIDTLLKKDFINRTITIAKTLFNEELPEATIERIVKNAFTFPAPLKFINERIFALELFHGPTLAFKDFGARFIAQLLSELNKIENSKRPLTILTATSGDTGAAVADAFYGLENVQVVILYPYQRISQLQEKLFCTLGNNIHTLAIQGDFDVCQSLVKECFNNKKLIKQLRLNSANSINISRIFAQCFYYFEAVAQLPRNANLIIAVPSGNFGNLTAGLFAQQMGLPVKSFIAVTNSNDTVPRYLKTGDWLVNSTTVTLSSAMDVSDPNNWPRIEELYKNLEKPISEQLRSIALNDEKTITAIQELFKLNYLAEPHSALAYAGLKACLQENEQGIFLCTAHPAKFKQSMEKIVPHKIPLPAMLANVIKKPILSTILPPDIGVIENYLHKLN